MDTSMLSITRGASLQTPCSSGSLCASKTIYRSWLTAVLHYIKAVLWHILSNNDLLWTSRPDPLAASAEDEFSCIIKWHIFENESSHPRSSKYISLNPGRQGHHKRTFVPSCEINTYIHLPYKSTLIWGKERRLSGTPELLLGGDVFQLKEIKPRKVLRQWNGPLHLLHVQGTLPAHVKTEGHQQPTGADTTFVFIFVSSFLALTTSFEPQFFHERGFCFVWIFC